ncbi:glutathione S-transferase N-terminal domain-containing protein [[Limnothrix rosea] IAM M-220]|uniref:glutathione S-transferase N-terminal domain-containing protein n=1 Tax=[Limnothrix rosea] IAM M-220 TaxID=454133 RepID=UPI00095E718D|nr:glutathione S-transferase N-terminal domain-containing protein [[Limnothrix rosea] IAM M-220]OKH11410.1 glutathione S-transferase [[Limnothrix rosea] IAM M-220]
MIDLYAYATPNGRKPVILLEELGLPYGVHKIDIGKGDQFSQDFLAISPNNKIPAIVDRDNGLSVFESGAILLYLAEKYGKFLPTDLAAKTKVVAWLMFQMASVGPMFGQLGHFRNAAPEKIDYAIARYEQEDLRLLGVLNRQLENNEFVVGDYSIADMALYPWIAAATTPHLQLSLDDFPDVQRWLHTVGDRPAVQIGMKIFTPDFSSQYAKVL